MSAKEKLRQLCAWGPLNLSWSWLSNPVPSVRLNTKRLKFSDSQIIDAVKRVESGIGVPDICRELGVSSATFYKWRANYGGMDVSMMSRMKELEEENRRLKKVYLEEKLKAEII